MTAGQLGHGWAVVLRRQPASITDGQAEGGYTDAFEIICCDCGDDPGLDYAEVSPELQRVRGPYPLTAGAVTYEKHIEWHQKAAERAGSHPARPAPGPR
jgi:hypothetical protein